MKDWAIVLDTTFNEELYVLDNVFFIPMEITAINSETSDMKVYKDYIELKPINILNLLKEKYILQTSQISQEVFKEKAKELLKNYKRIIFLTLSKGLTKQFESLLLVQKELNEELKSKRVIVIDTKTASMSGVWVTKAIITELEKNPEAEEETLQIINDNILKRTMLQAVVTDVNFIIRGGRLTGVKAFFAKRLDLKIIIELDSNGVINKIGHDTNVYKALDKMWKDINQKLNSGGNKISEIYLLTLWDENDSLVYTDYIQAKISDINLTIKHKYMPSAIASHTGEVISIVAIRE